MGVYGYLVLPTWNLPDESEDVTLHGSHVSQFVAEIGSWRRKGQLHQWSWPDPSALYDVVGKSVWKEWWICCIKLMAYVREWRISVDLKTSETTHLHKHIDAHTPLKSAVLFALAMLTSALLVDKSSLELYTQRRLCFKATPKLQYVVSCTFPTDFVQDIFPVGGVNLGLLQLKMLLQVDQETVKFDMNHFHKFVFKSCDPCVLLKFWTGWLVVYLMICKFLYIWCEFLISANIFHIFSVPKNQPTHPIYATPS